MPVMALTQGMGSLAQDVAEQLAREMGLTGNAQPALVIKGRRAETESYSAIGPEVLVGPDGEPLGEKNESFLRLVIDSDADVIAGEAKSHCVAWTVEDLLSEIQGYDKRLASKVYLLEDCTSPVVVPGVVDTTDQAEAAFRCFAAAGMHIVQSTIPISSWPGISTSLGE